MTSGGLNTIRRQKGKDTAGQEGDITAVHDFGKGLLLTCCIECKSGYPKLSPLDLIDIPASNKTNEYKGFIEQCIREMEDNDKPYFWLIHKKSRRNCTITMPITFYNKYREIFGDFTGVTLKTKYSDDLTLFTCDFDLFLDWFKPEYVFGKYQE